MEDIDQCKNKARCFSERRYRMLFDAITDGVMVVGVSPHGIPDKIIEVNRIACKSTSFTQEELLAMKPSDLLETSIPQEVIAAAGRFGANKNYLFESICLTKSGEKLPIEISARAFEMEGQAAILMIARDISERKKAREALLLSEERFSRAFNLAPSMMAISSAEDGRFLYVNDSFVRAMGYQREELLARTSDEIRLWVEPGEHQYILEYFCQNESLNNYEINFRNRKGDIGTYLVSAQRISFNRQNAIIFVINDITERKLCQAELARLDRLNLVGKMAAEIGHEIRNPLTTVRGFLQMMKIDEKMPHRLEFYDVMIEELDRANSIIIDFLALAKDRRVDIKCTNLNDIIICLLPLLEAEALRQGKQVVFNAGDIPLLFLDNNEIRQLILNLVYNGLEAMPAGGEASISSYQEGNQVVVSVKDRGTGIPLDIIPKLGTPFFTTKEKRTGLGLAICYSIAARHHATIDVSSSEQGTNIMVKFKAG